MPDQKISEVDALVTLDTADFVPIVDASVTTTKRVTISTLDARYLLSANNLSDVADQQTSIDALTNVAAATDEHVLTKDTATGNAVFKAVVASVFTRTGAVVATAGDYTASLITNTPAGNIAAVTAQAAIDELDTEKAGLSLANVFTAAQKVNVNSAVALLVEWDGVKDNVLVVDTANGRVGVGMVPGVGAGDALEAYGNIRIKSTGDRQFKIDNTASGMFFAFGIATSTMYFSSGATNNNFEWRDYNGAALMKIVDGKLGLGTINPAAKAHPITTDDVTAAITNIAILGHNSTGTPLANFGAGLKFQLESSTTENQDAARLATLWNVATHASRVADLVAYASDFNAEREIWRGRANGTNPMFAVLGQTPAARQAHITDPSGGGVQDAEARTAINAVLLALETFGFLATA